MLTPFITDVSQVIKMVGAVTFIRVLLVMAGVEPNPGPGNKKFVFRYQYLLIEVGTEVMQKLFDAVIGTDFGSYLATNVTAATKLQWLIGSGKIKPTQKNYLPPIDTHPLSSNFDITLLSCLLRNVCGLRHFNDAVWKNPAPGDHSLEADVTKLRECRNDVAHMRSVYLLDTDLAVKKTELTEILKRLNSCHGNGVPDLPSKINQAEQVDIDDKMSERYNTIVDQWIEMERLYDLGIRELTNKFEEFEQGLNSLNTAANNLRQGQSEITQDLSVIKQDQHLGQFEITQELSVIKQDQQQGQSEIKQELSVIKQDQQQGQSEITQDLSVIKQDQQQGQSEITQDLSVIKQDQQQGQSEIKQELSVIKQDQQQGQSEIKQDLSEIKQEVQKDREKAEQYQKEQGKLLQEIRDTQQDTKLYDEKDLKNRLLKMYHEECSTLPVLPLCDDDEEEVALLSLYQRPSLFHVPYHRTEEKEEPYLISSYEEMFSKGDQCFSKVFITGDAGVGKSSFCKCMSLLWYKSLCNEKVNDEVTQKNIEFMGKFDFTFFVSLRDTDRTDVITMIVEQVYTETECAGKMNELYKLVENTLNERVCLVILDGLDEWTPQTSRKKQYALPDKITADKCSFLITCRPYKIETVRLSLKDLDRQVQIRGICRESKRDFVKKIVARCNKANGENKDPNAFYSEVKKCGLSSQLSIPILGAQMVAIWFDCKLTEMSRALIYSNILEMLFERAEKRCKDNHKKRRIHSPSVPIGSVQLPDSLADLVYFKTHFALLENMCYLSFRSLFKLDKCVSVLVYTRKQLMSEPYFFSDENMDFLCKIGILSRNKVIGRIGKQEQKLSFLHKSYLEYFAALFVSSFDSSKAFDNVVQEWTTLNDIMQFQNFFIFLTGFSCEKVKYLFEDIYTRISDDLTCCRRNAIFQTNNVRSPNQIISLQSMIIKCFQQVSRSSNPNFSLKLEDFIFHSQYDRIDNLFGDDGSDSEYDSDSLSGDTEVSPYVGSLKQQLLLSNRACIQYLLSVGGKYFVEFGQIENLQVLEVFIFHDYMYDVKFTELMLQNGSKLHTVCIGGFCAFIPELPVSSLQHLTSLSLHNIKMQHNSLDNLVECLSNNVLIENIKFSLVYCDNHELQDSDCTLTLNLLHHKELASLNLYHVNMLCNNVNTRSLKSFSLFKLPEIVSSYSDVFNCMKFSQLEHLHIHGSLMLDYSELTCAVKTLRYIKLLKLEYMKLPDDVLLQLHPDVTQVEIELHGVSMSRQCIHSFIVSFVNNTSVIKVEVLSDHCGELSAKESVEYMSVYLQSIPTVHITHKRIHEHEHDRRLHFETRSCQ